jgi:hypothetical protein
MSAQAHLFHEQLDVSRERFAEAERENVRAPVQVMEQADTFRGDLAMKLGHPEDALESYARSLSAADAMGNELQVLLDLLGVTTALAELGRDGEALEVAGLAEAQGIDVSSTNDSAFALFSHLLGDAAIVAATERLGDASGAHRARGRSVPAGRRVAAACALARVRP